MPRVVFPSSPAADWTRGLVKADHFEDNRSFNNSNLWQSNPVWEIEIEEGLLGRGGFGWFYVGATAKPTSLSCYVAVEYDGRVLTVIPFDVATLEDGTVKRVGYADMSELVVFPCRMTVKMTFILRFGEPAGGNINAGVHFYHVRR